MHRKWHGQFDEYLDEAVYGANDGIITTFAVVSGAAGATLGGDTIIILGIANLIADGFSMGASSYLAIKTKEEVREANGLRKRSALKLKAMSRSAVTFGAFVLAGAIPLLPFLNGFAAGREFEVSAVAAAITFFLVGGARTIVTRRGFFKSGVEMFVVGSIASVLAYAIGFFVEAIVV
jgi:VIT1/CCC1 family predicted Fe2+/Mn2+ transporter